MHVKRALGGGGQSCPPPLRLKMVLWVPVTQTQTLAQQSSRHGSVQTPEAKASSTGPHSAEGRARPPGMRPHDYGSAPLVCEQAANTAEGGKNTTERIDHKHPCRLASKNGSQKGQVNTSPPTFRENPKKTPKRPGPRNGTPTKREKKRTHSQNG